MKNKFKSYTFWLALIGAVIILINTLGTTFGFGVNEVAITSIATAVLGIFVTLGVVKKDTKPNQENQQENISDEQTNDRQKNTFDDSKKEDNSKDNLDSTDQNKKG